MRLRYLRNDLRVSLTVVERGNWYRSATIIGRAELHDDTGLADIDRLALRYTGAPYVDRVRPRVSAWIERRPRI